LETEGETESVLTTTGPSSPEPPRARYSLTINSAGVFLAGVAIQVIGFVGSLFIYKYIGISAGGQALFGTVQFFLLIASTINGIADLRLGGGYQLFLARGKPATATTGTYLLMRFALVGLAAGLVLVFSGVSFGGTVLAPSQYDFEVIAIFMSLPVLWTVETVYSNYYIGIGNSVKGQYPGLIEVLVRTPVLIVAVFAFPTILGLTTAYLIGAIASVLFCLPALIPLVRRFNRREAVLLLRYSWPLLGALGLATIATNAIPFIVEATLGVQQLNLFNAANSFRILAIALPSAITTPLFPYLASLHKRSEHNAIREATWTAMRFSSMLLIPGVVALIVYRVNILYILFNGLYVPAQYALAILVASSIPASLALIMGTGLAAIGWRRLELYLTAVQVALLFAIAILLLPPYGILPASDGLISASIAVLASGTAAWALNSYFTSRLMAVGVFPRSLGAIALAAVVAFLAISRINAVLPINRYYQLTFGILVGFLVYFLVLALIGELTKEDIHRIGRSMGFPGSWLNAAARLCWRPKSLHLLAKVDTTEVPGLTAGYIPDDDAVAGRTADARLPPRKR
jgi:O-antigen/teichoic acid export membrane protein